MTFGVALAGLLVSYPLYIEARWVETTRTRIELPELRRPLRLLHLSDLHLGDGVSQEDLLAIAGSAIDEARPNLICLTGDYVSRPTDPDTSALGPVIERLARAAPVYAVMGNHDGGAWSATHGGPATNDSVRERLQQSGAVVLQNRWTRVEVAGQPLLLVGTGDLWSLEADPPAAFADAPSGLPTILLTHNPDTKQFAERFSWHLMLAGHTHGNQVNLPFWDERWATVRDQRFIAGHHWWNGRQLHINRGLGGVGGIRFRSRPEISILELVPRI
jgi:predicted MPP superfamily phosphohydrolase